MPVLFSAQFAFCKDRQGTRHLLQEVPVLAGRSRRISHVIVTSVDLPRRLTDAWKDFTGFKFRANEMHRI